MDRPETIEHLKAILVTVLNIEPDRITEDSHLFDDLGLDSTSSIELLMAMEDTMGLQIDPDELEPAIFETVGSLADYIQTGSIPEPA